MQPEPFPWVWFDGAVVPASRLVAADDHGLVTGDGAFETVRILDTVPFAASEHLARLARSLLGLGLPVPDLAEVHRAMVDLSARSGLGDGRLRITVTAGRAPLSSARGSGPPTVLVAVERSTPVPDVEAVVTCPWRRNERSALAGIKSTSYAENVVALAWAKARGAGEVLFLNTVGEVSEGSGSNLFAVIDGMVVTPPVDSSGCLAGVTRAIVLELDPSIVERPIVRGDLQRATEVFLTSTSRDVQPVGVVDGRRLAAAPAPVTKDLRAAFLERREAMLAATTLVGTR